MYIPNPGNFTGEQVTDYMGGDNGAVEGNSSGVNYNISYSVSDGGGYHRHPPVMIDAEPPHETYPRRGAQAVEFALLSPVFVGLILSICNWGLYFQNSMTVASATATGARAGAIATAGDSDDTTNGQCSTCGTTAADVDPELLSSQGISGTATVNASLVDIGGGTCGLHVNVSVAQTRSPAAGAFVPGTMTSCMTVAMDNGVARLHDRVETGC
jgi:Flp pilus assembly protein TadG